MKALNGKVALVTGASRGIGRAIAERLAREGALVAVNYVQDVAAAAETVAAITAGGGSAFALQGDVGDVGGIDRLLDRFDAALSAFVSAGNQSFPETGMDILVNNAGQGKGGSFPYVSEADYDRVMNINAKGPLFLCQAVVTRLRDGGRIINLSSGASKAPAAAYISYAMSKAALDALTVAMAGNLGPRGITVNAVSPGPTITSISERLQSDQALGDHIKSITALGRFGVPADIVGIIAFLASDDAGWVTGQRIDVSGGRGLVSAVGYKPQQSAG